MQSESYPHDEEVPSFRNGPHLLSASPVKHILAPTDLTAQSR
jgi:hypothetical protein